MQESDYGKYVIYLYGKRKVEKNTFIQVADYFIKWVQHRKKSGYTVRHPLFGERELTADEFLERWNCVGHPRYQYSEPYAPAKLVKRMHGRAVRTWPPHTTHETMWREWLSADYSDKLGPTQRKSLRRSQ